MTSKRLYFVIILILFSAFGTFAKGKGDKTELPQNVVEKISSAEATNQSWYLCKIKGKRTAGEVILGPLETEEQAYAAWIFYNIKPQKKHCIAKNLTFRTDNPESFKSDLYNTILYNYKKYSNTDFVNYYFLNTPLPSDDMIIIQESEKQEKSENEVKNKVEPEKTELTNSEDKSESSTEATEKSENDSKNKTNAEPEKKDKETVAEKQPVTQDKSDKIEAENQLKEKKTEEEIKSEQKASEPQKEDKKAALPAPVSESKNQVELKKSEEENSKLNITPDTKPDESQNAAKTENQPSKKETEAPKAIIPPKAKVEPKEEKNEPVFELQINTNSGKNYSRYQKEFLQDYAPKKTPAVPEALKEKEYLIPEPNKIDSKGRTPLMISAMESDIDNIDLLIKSGADISLTDNDGWTALMYAVRYQTNKQVVQKLISYGANTKSASSYGVSALYLAAVYNNNSEILQLILKDYSYQEKEFLQAFVLVLTDNSFSEEQRIKKIDVFLQKGASLNVFYNGKTPLMYVCQYSNSSKILKKLIDSGAQANLISTEGKTAFEYASENKALPRDDTYWNLNKNR